MVIEQIQYLFQKPEYFDIPVSYDIRPAIPKGVAEPFESAHGVAAIEQNDLDLEIDRNHLSVSHYKMSVFIGNRR